MYDPRKDLAKDTQLWELVLACANQYQDKQIFGNLHGFRCAGSRLSIKDENLILSLPSEWGKELKSEMINKYLTPYIKQRKELFKFVAEFYEEHQKKQKDYLTRDVFTDGYIV